jgi:hypothetical protein
MVPHPAKNGSGDANGSQHQRLDESGRQSQSGQRTRLNTFSSRTIGTVIVTLPVRF